MSPSPSPPKSRSLILEGSLPLRVVCCQLPTSNFPEGGGGANPLGGGHGVTVVKQVRARPTSPPIPHPSAGAGSAPAETSGPSCGAPGTWTYALPLGVFLRLAMGGGSGSSFQNKKQMFFFLVSKWWLLYFLLVFFPSQNPFEVGFSHFLAFPPHDYRPFISSPPTT